MSGITGDPNLLRKVADQLRSTKDADYRTAQIAAAPLTGQMQADFGARRGPDGASWGGRYSLVRSGALRASLVFRQDGKGLRVSGLPPYARYQNPRRFIPRGGSKLPASYRAIVDLMRDRAIKLILEGG